MNQKTKEFLIHEFPRNIELTVPIPPAYRVDKQETLKVIPYNCILKTLHVFFHPGTQSAIRDFIFVYNNKILYSLKMSADGFEDFVPLNIIAKSGDLIWFEATNYSEAYTYHPIVEVIISPIRVEIWEEK